MEWNKDDDLYGRDDTNAGADIGRFDVESGAGVHADTGNTEIESTEMKSIGVESTGTTGEADVTAEPETAGSLGSGAYTNTTYTGAYSAGGSYNSSYRAAYHSDAVYSPYADGNRPQKEKDGGNEKPDSFGRKLLRTVALALVFGLVAGLVFRGVNVIGNSGSSASGQSEETTQIESTQPAADTDGDGLVESTAVAPVSVVTDVSEIAEQTLPSIVQVSNISLVQYRSFFGQLRTYEVPSAGSGIIISQDDDYIYIATNNHVVANASELTITFCDDASVAAVIVGTVPERDLAVVSVKISDVEPETLSAIRVAVLGSSDDLIVGQGAIVIGNALGYGQSVTVGYISAKDREVTIENDDGSEVSNLLIQTDAAVNPGNSGGALLNMRGEVVGIVSAKYSDTSVEGMGYAIPITEAKEIIQEIIDGGVPETATTASGGTDLPAGTAYLGIYGMDIDETTAEQYDMPTGVYVSQVIRGSAADEAGLNRGDVILSIDGEEVTSMEAVREYITAKEPGDEITIVYSSWNSDYEEEETVTVALGAVE